MKIWNPLDLERVEKAAIRLILGKKNENYEDGLLRANLESLIKRSEKSCKTFAIKYMKYIVYSQKRKLNIEEKFSKTNTLKNSSIPYMQKIINS